MKLIEADKVKRVMKDYWKAQVDKALTLTFTDGNEANKRINGYLEHNHELLKAVDELPSAEPDTTTHDSIPVETGKNDSDRTSGDCISRQQAIDALKNDMASLDHIIKGMSANDVRLDAYVSQRNQVNYDICTINSLPHAQPDTNCSEIPNNSDTISRQAAIDFVGSMNMCDEISNEACKKLTSYLDELPSVQPERKTDNQGAKKESSGRTGMIRQEQCDKVCRILDDVLANRPTERDSLIVATRKAFDALEQAETNCSEIPNNWIPCGERQPDVNGWYITTISGEICGQDRAFSGMSEFANGKWVCGDDVDETEMTIAWIPLPEPYQEGGEQS